MTSGSPAAGRSSVLPSGFEARVRAVAVALLAWLDAPADPELESGALVALGELEAHLLVDEERARVNRLQMAARLVRWLATAWTPAGTLKGTVADYLADGAWRDRARETVSRGDRHPGARAALAAIDGRVAELVRTHGPATARQLANAAARQDELLGVEDLLATVAARAGADVPVLVLVLDGMGWPSFLEIAGHLDRQGWHPVTADGLPAQPAALATLPTVTEYSRTSLLCGKLRSGDGESEKRAFKELAPLRALGSTEPQLFQKKDLRQGGLDTLSEQVVSAIEDTNQRVVGVVLNNIDERLKDVEAPPSGWDLDTLTPLRELLRAARQGGRALVVTADHGHILHREDVARPAADEGGERWRATSTGPAGEGEIDVRGPRVVPEPHSCVMPWDEQIHYGPKRNGYHGGLTPVELIVPAVVLMTDEVEGWEPLAVPAPAWWYETIAPAPVEEVVPEPVPGPKAPSRKKPSAPTLFDPDPVEESAADEAAAAAPAAGGDWVDRLLALEAIGSQLEPLRLDEAEVASALRLLGRAGGTPVQEERLADTLGRPRARIGRFVMQLQRLLNMDGYETVASSNGAVRLDRQLLENQVGKL